MGLHPSVAAVRNAVRRDLDALAAADPASGPAAVPAPTLLVACSGGPDSVALLAATVFVTRRDARRVVGVSVDHGLQEGSAAHAARVVRQMAAMGADETVTARVQVSATGRGPEAAAREARYAVLEQVAEHVGAAAVLLGHTLDDQAETVLLGLTRGAGARSLAGMRRGFGRYRRPLLDVRRADTVTACQVEGHEVWHDPHNDDPGYTRVRVRHRVLPVLEDELGPGVAATLARTADALREDTALLDELAAGAHARVRREAGPGLAALDAAELDALAPALRGRVARAAALEAGALDGELTRGHVLAVLALAAGPAGPLSGKQAQLPGHVTASREGSLLRFRRTTVES